METNATLTYTGENKVFRCENGQFTITGQKVIDNGNFSRVDGGTINKNGYFLGSYNHQVENGTMKNLWVNFADPMQAVDILAQISACFEALKTDGVPAENED